MASLSKLDAVYRSLLLTKFFTKGWGHPEKLKRLFAFRKIISNRETCKDLVSPNYPIVIEKVDWNPQYQVYHGHFVSPLYQHLPDVMPQEVTVARFEMILPTSWRAPPLKPVCLHLAGTGDHFYWKRRVLLARPLLKEAGIGSIILENPFYGSRKPQNQMRSSLHNVSDIFVMGGCLILEALALFHWCEKEGFGPLGITGISMGGHMASVAGCNWHKPLPIIPCLSWSTASCVFTQGVMSGAIPWPLLQNQYSKVHAFQDEIRQMVHSPEESDAFHAGVHFSRTYPSSMDRMNKLANEEHNLFSGNNQETNSQKTHSVSAAQKVAKDFGSSEKILQNVLTVPKSTTTTAERNFSANSAEKSKRFSSQLERDALDFMHGIMDECTHLANFTPPVDPSLSIVVTAKHDAYIPRDGIKSIEELWPGCEIRYIDCGHVAAFLFNQGVFRKAIIDAFEKTAQTYHGQSIFNNVTFSPLQHNSDNS